MNGWRTARLYPPGDVLIVQLGHDPVLYDWSAVRDCVAVLYTEAFDRRTTDRMLQVLETAGVSLVSCYPLRAGARRVS
ncbi:MAG TPA: hypothetical protein PK163_03135 [Steroidobacteraceae bacterium]|nr:hypothetical protein [Steroidobacteraceae bacterium]